MTDDVNATGDTLFYRGDLDHKRAEAPNGAVVNEDYLRTLSEGAWGSTRIHAVRDGVHSIVGYSISNYTFVESDNGLIAFDTGNNIGMGREALRLIRDVSDKPIVAIIYSHHHYTGGALAYVEDAGTDIPVFGHPDVDANMRSTAGLLGPMQFRRIGIQFGFYLPHEGPDAAFGPAEPTFDDPALNATGHVPVSHPVKDGEEATIDGVRVIFHQVVADTRDSLLVHFPDLALILHNSAVTPMSFPLYTLRGDFYRTPPEMIAGLDLQRKIRPTYTVGCHGTPILTADEGYEITTAHRDAYAFIYNQSVRAINNGLTPDEMANTIRLPEHLDQHEWLFPAYIDNEYSVRAQYRGIVGWYAEDTADLHPPTPVELSGTIVDGFGGVDAVIETAQAAMEQGKYNLTAKLLSYVLEVAPEHPAARQLKADALRAMAQTTRSGVQTRNFLLSHALHLEEKIDWTQPPEFSLLGTPSVEAVLATPSGTYLKLLEAQVNPNKSADISEIINVTFTDLDQGWSIHVRKGVVEVTDPSPDATATLALERSTWAEIAINQTTIEEAINTGNAQIQGSPDTITAVFNVFTPT